MILGGLFVITVVLVMFFKPLGPLGQKVFGSNDWYAVHLNNGHVYYGKLKTVTPETIVLARTYYLEVYNQVPNQLQPPQESKSFRVETAPQPQTIYNLVRRGSTGTIKTDGALFINRSVVLFWEKLEPDADIVKNIESAEKTR